MNGHSLHARRNDHQIRLNSPGEEAGGKILINHPFHPFELPLDFHNGYATSSATDDHLAEIDHLTNRPLLDNPCWFWRGDDTPVSPASILDNAPSVLYHGVNLLFGEERANRFRRILKRRVVLVHQTLGYNGVGDFVDSPSGKNIVNLPLEKIADPPLTVRSADVKRQWIDDIPSCFYPSENVSHLRAVPVGCHHLVPGFNEIDDVFGCDVAVADLIRDIPLLIRTGDGIPAQGYDNSHCFQSH